MRRFSIFLALLLACLLGLALAAPSFIDWQSHKSAIALRLSAALGREVRIAGDLDLSLLPRPTLTAEALEVDAAPGSRLPHLARIGALDITLSLPALLQGRLETTQFQLRAADIVIERLPDGRFNWQRPEPPSQTPSDRGSFGFGLADLQVSGLEIHGGSLRWLTAERDLLFLMDEALLGDWHPNAVFQAEGRFSLDDQPFGWRLKRGRALSDGSHALNLALTLPDEAALLQASGRLLPEGGTDLFQGRLKGEGMALADIMALSTPFGLEFPLPSVPFQVQGDLAVSQSDWDLEGLTFRLGDNAFKGRAAGSRARGGTVEVALESDHLDFDALAAAWDKRAPRLPADAKLRLAVNAGAASLRGGLLRNLTLELTFAKGALDLEKVAATLPGGATLDVIGAVDWPTPAAPRLAGHLIFASDNLRPVLAWLGIEAGKAAPGRLGRARLEAALELTHSRLVLRDAKARLDNSHAEGALALALRERPGFGLGMHLDNLDLLDYFPDWGLEDAKVWEALRDSLTSFDANLDIEIGALAVGTNRLQDLALDGTLEDGRLTLHEARVARWAGSKLAIEGLLDLGVAGFDGRLQLAASEPGLLAQALAPVTRLPPGLPAFLLTAEMKGNLQSFSGSGSYRDLAGETAFAGKFDPEQGAAALVLELDYKKGGALAGRLGLGPFFTQVVAPLKARLDFEKSGARYSFSGLSGHLGKTTLKGRGHLDVSAPRPRWDAELALGSLPLASLRDMTTALAPGGDPARLFASEGAWSHRPLALPAAFPADGRLQLTLERLTWPGGGLEALELDAEISASTLLLKQISARAGPGTLLMNGEMSLGPTPALNLAATGTELDPASLFDGSDTLGPPSGALGFNLRLASSGASPKALMEGLRGDGRLQGPIAFAEARPGFLARLLAERNMLSRRRLPGESSELSDIEAAFLEGQNQLEASFKLDGGRLEAQRMALAGKDFLLQGALLLDLSGQRLQGRFAVPDPSPATAALLALEVEGPLGTPSYSLRGSRLSAP